MEIKFDTPIMVTSDRMHGDAVEVRLSAVVTRTGTMPQRLGEARVVPVCHARDAIREMHHAMLDHQLRGMEQPVILR